MSFHGSRVLMVLMVGSSTVPSRVPILTTPMLLLFEGLAVVRARRGVENGLRFTNVEGSGPRRVF